MSQDVRLTQPALKVLRFLMETPREGRSGAEMSKATKVGSGTLYPMLARLEAAGWLTSEWEVIDPSEARTAAAAVLSADGGRAEQRARGAGRLCRWPRESWQGFPSSLCSDWNWR